MNNSNLQKENTPIFNMDIQNSVYNLDSQNMADNSLSPKQEPSSTKEFNRNLITLLDMSSSKTLQPDSSRKNEVFLIPPLKFQDRNNKIDQVWKCLDVNSKNNHLNLNNDEVEDGEEVFETRQKSNTFGEGYIQTHIPWQQQKSRFGCNLNLNLKSHYSSVIENEVGSLQDFDSVEELPSNNHNERSEFAKRRSKIFKTFQPYSLKLITLPLTHNTQSKPTISKRIKFEDKFELLEKIGEGCHSVVRRCAKKDQYPVQSLAVKIIAYKDPEYLFEILQEERVLSILNHKNIVKYDSFYLEKENKKAYIVCEYARGKPLAHFIQTKKQFDILTLRNLTQQLLKGVYHMHSKGIIHRDLSYNNIIFDPLNEEVKIIDFTVSKIVTMQKLFTNTGTLQFKAPEMLSGKFYSHAIDMWAIGVNLFALIFGYLPFEDSEDALNTIVSNITMKNPLEQIKTANVVAAQDPAILHFLEGLLEKNPLKRMTAKEALNHPWIEQKITCDDFRARRQRLCKKGTASTAAELDEAEKQNESFTSLNQFMVKTLVNIQMD